MSKLVRLIIISVVTVFVLLVGGILYFTVQSNFQTKNMRLLAVQIDKTGWEEYSYNIYSESVSSGFFSAEIWGPNGTYLTLSAMALDGNLEESYFDQINDVRVCINGLVKFTEFVESQTGKANLTFTEALLSQEKAINKYKSRLGKGQNPKLPHFYDGKGDCNSILNVSIPQKIEKTIRYN